MAGVYPDIPGTRFALDKDGTVAKRRDYTAQSDWTDVTSSLVNIQTVSTSSHVAMTLADDINYSEISFAFPEARTVSGLYVHAGSTSSGFMVQEYRWEYSQDTTDGTDGTWTSFTTDFSFFDQHRSNGHSSKPYYRSDIAPVSLTNVKGIRFRFYTRYNTTARLFVLHIYGSRPTSGVDRLAYWHPTLDQAISPSALDFGDIPQGDSGTRQVRVHNLSGSQTANDVSVSVNDVLPEYDTGDLQLSSDNSTFVSSLSLGNLSPGATSPIIYIRRTVPAAQTPGLRNARLITEATSWS